MNANNSEDRPDATNSANTRIIDQHLADLIDLAHDAIIVRDPASTIIFWNQGAQTLYGWTKEEAIGRVSHQLLQTRFPQSQEVTDMALAQGEKWEGQLIHTRRDGEQVIVESRQVVMRDSGVSNRPNAILEINRDITEREHLQRQQIEVQTHELSLQKTKERMDDFLGIISHELRTPMTTIKGNIQLAKMRLLYAMRGLSEDNGTIYNILEEIQMVLERAERQANVQIRLIRDLLDISYIQAGQLDLQQEQSDLTAIVTEAIEGLQSALPACKIHMVTSAEESIPVLADAERINQVINNYVTNALKYSPEDRPVEVRLEKRGNMVCFSVRDQGPGLSPSEQVHIWERFYRVERIKRQRGFSLGMGLGLYICKAIIQQHGGEVGVESTEEKGSTFWFTLPIAEGI